MVVLFDAEELLLIQQQRADRYHLFSPLNTYCFFNTNRKK